LAELIRIAVPVALDRDFTYRASSALTPGTRVLVPFGKRTLVGVVRPGPAPPPETGKLRDVIDALDPPGRPALGTDLVALCEWIVDYYVAPAGEVYRLALPGLLTSADARLVSLTRAGRTRAAVGDAPLLTADGPVLTRDQQRLLESIAAAGERVPITQLARIADRVNGPLARLEELEVLGLVGQSWDGEGRDETRTETCYRRTDYLRGGDADEEALQAVLGRSKLRRGLLDYLETQASQADAADEQADWVPISELRGPFPRARKLLEPLVESGVVALAERARSLDPFETDAPARSEAQAPTDDQRAALDRLWRSESSGSFESFLLHGITGSGKTEVYLQLIERVRGRGGGAIVLVPEIALTPQLSDRFRARFGDEVAVLHSGLSPRRRLDAWAQIRDGRRPIVIGARSAVFAPVPELRVIVVDEEHDGSFKQEDGVRYNARDVALVRARDLGATVVLGSATPSLESFANAEQGKHERLVLRHRPTPRPLPGVEILDLAEHRAHPDTMMSARLRDAVLETVAAGEQAIVFLNRRGYATTLVCGGCGALQQCPDCSAPSMTYHLARNRLVCHLCGHMEATPEACRVCGAKELEHGNAGTERIELAIERELAGVRVARLDRDTSRGKRLLEVLGRFRRGEADVLVGTQMLSKGHDFPGVTLVGILQGDHGLGMPDLRASERTFQLLTQVSGRAGRGDRPGRVLVQAWAVDHPAIVRAASHDYDGFAAEELAAREELGNPPFGHLALVKIVGADAQAVARRAQHLGERTSALVRTVLEGHPSAPEAVRVLGPVPAPIERVNNKVRWQLLVRSRPRPALRWLLERLRPHLGHEGHGAAHTVAIVDVDPQTLM